MHDRKKLIAVKNTCPWWALSCHVQTGAYCCLLAGQSFPSERWAFTFTHDVFLPTQLNRPTLSLNKAKVPTLHLDSPASPSSLLISHPPAPGLLLFHLVSLHRYTLARDRNCKGTGADLNVTLSGHLLFETYKCFIAKLGALPPPATFWHHLLPG